MQAAIKGYGYQGQMIQLFEQQLADLRRHNVESLFSNSLVESTSILSLLFAQLIVTCAGGLLAIEGIITPGALVAYLSLLGVLHKELYDVAKRIFPNIVAAAGTVQRLEELLGEIPQVQDAADASALPPVRGDICLSGVSFSYNGVQNQLDQLDLTIPAGRYAAIVGSSGAGKSTLLSLLLRFYDVTAGAVTIDGYDVRQVTQASLRTSMGIVFQEPLLLNTSIRDNIRMAQPEASQEEVEAAARAAEIQTADDVVVFPESAFGFVLARKGAEFPDDDALRRRFEGQREHDALDILPFLENQVGVELADRLEKQVLILTGMFEAIQGGAHFLGQILVTWGELIAKQVENGKIDLVGAVGIGRMNGGVNVGRIIEKQIEDKVAFMFVGANDSGVDGNMIRNQGVGNDTFVQTEVLGGMPRIERMAARFKLLTVATGMNRFAQIVLPKDGQRSGGIADEIIGDAQGLQADEIIRNRDQSREADI